MTDEPGRPRLRGLHHVTAISSDLRRTTDFYRDVLSLTLVRETTTIPRHATSGSAMPRDPRGPS